MPQLIRTHYPNLLILVTMPEQLYRMVIDVVLPGIYPCHQSLIRNGSSRRIEVELEVPPAPVCEAFFQAAQGGFEGLCELLDLPAAEVRMSLRGHRCTYTILFPRSESLRTRIRRLLATGHWTRAPAELEAQQRPLRENYQALHRAYEEMAKREAMLLAEIQERSRIEEAYQEQEQQLRQAQKMESIGKLAGGIAHDFNNHLTVVNLYAEAIEQTDDLSEAHRFAGRILVAANTAAKLTSQLLAFARKQALQPKALDLNELIGSCDDMLRRTLGERASLEVVRGGGLGMVRADPGQLEQALVNLAINARDAIGEHQTGHLTVETANVYLDREYVTTRGAIEPGRYVMLAVSDDGPGIPEEQLEYIFEPFFTTKPTGTGLGLSMVQGFVAQSGGLLTVYSELGAGTTFKVYLPRIAREVPSETLEQSTVLEELHGNERILVVENESVLCELVAQALRNHGYDVTAAEDGATALALAKATTPDLILTDVIMPGMNGNEVVEAVRVEHPEMLAVYMSGYTENAIIHSGEMDEGIILLQKPFTVRELLLVLRATIDAAS
ncbi:MAG: ATP-binding protein [Pseudomonadota bacterium]